MAQLPITVMTADDHPVFRQGVASVLASDAGFQLVAEAAGGREAIAHYRSLRPDLVLMDIQMPDLDGVEATQIIRNEYPRAAIVVLTTYEGDALVMRAMKAGAAGYLLKSAARREMLDTLRAIHAGQRHVPPLLVRAVARQLPGDTLTPREIQVLELAALGKSNRLIGRQLCIAEETVKVHMKNLMSKLQANDRTHAVLIALGRGIIGMRTRPRPLAG
ncbi:DNA-binding NarL/FixJ family response regulator [Duganella sp. SG902]|uniref:response regulator n=1 Tax=Duganella sp. SG902 TaxID=2587016 RepID=UPI00159E2147|nr:response regulator transcription factor [Duganella sp. SG902]NVM76251.1 DNA-binding NarL/FixJ family response regulator [Duganella sp. SG902]